MLSVTVRAHGSFDVTRGHGSTMNAGAVDFRDLPVAGAAGLGNPSAVDSRCRMARRKDAVATMTIATGRTSPVRCGPGMNALLIRFDRKHDTESVFLDQIRIGMTPAAGLRKTRRI